MKRWNAVLTALMLSGMLLFTSACSSPPPDKIIQCLGNIAFKVLATLPEGAEPLTFASLLEVGPVCLDATLTAFTSSPGSSTEIDINPAPSETTVTKSVTSNTWQNCSSHAQFLQFSFDVPFQMIVGPQDQQGIFSSRPGGSLENERIAQQLFDQYSNTIQQTTTNGPSMVTKPLFVPAHTQVTLTMSIALDYQAGEARVSNNGSTDILPWMFPVGFTQVGNLSGPWSPATNC